MNELKLKTVPAVIDSNFVEIKQRLAQELKDYDEVVTAATVASAKKRATELNKMSTDLKSAIKRAVDEVSKPISSFKEKGKELDVMIQDVRGRILDQVKVFEDETLKEVEVALKDSLDSAYGAMNVREEFQTAVIDDLIKLSAFTSAGNLTKAARESVEAKAQQCQVVQQRTDLRLSQLENESYKAGLHSPLTREHVAGILFSNFDEEYNSRLKDLISRELQRQQETLDRAEKIRQQEELAQQIQPAPEQQPNVEAPVAQPQNEAAPVEAPQQPSTTGPTRVLDVTVSLQVTVPVSVSTQAIEADLAKRLASAGIAKSVKSIVATEAFQKGAA